MSTGLCSLVSSTSSFLSSSILLLELDLIVLDSVLPYFGASTVINAMISGGNLPYSINWNDLDTSQQRVVGAGYYEVQIFDANGCSTSGSVLITEPDSLEISVSYTYILCNQGATATVSAIGVTPPYSYLWSTGDTTATIDSLWGLTYWVSVSDSYGGISITDTIQLSNYELNTEVYYND